MEANAYSQDRKKWNRKLINIYWGVIIALIPVEFLHLLYGQAIDHDVLKHIAIPALVMILIMLVLEIAHKFTDQLLDYCVISGGAMIVFIVIYVNPDVKSVILSLLLPILIAIFYFQRSRIIFSIALTGISISTLYLNRLSHFSGYMPQDLVAMIPIVGFASFIALGIMRHGVELLDNLRKTTESKQELMIKNILMDKLSKTDALTDLYNHISFHEYLEKLIEQSEYGYLSIHVAVLDIDNFKKINDTYGHRAGDAVLKKVGAVLKERVGLNDFAARYGGEEFAIIFTEKSMSEVFEILEHIRWHVSQTKYEECNGHAVTISIGLSQYLKGSSKEQLFTGADQALYKAKKTGKNKTVIYTPAFEEAN